jgi:hypothetical protein
VTAPLPRALVGRRNVFAAPIAACPSLSLTMKQAAEHDTWMRAAHQLRKLVLAIFNRRAAQVFAL